MSKQSTIFVAVCIPNFTIGGVETVFVNMMNELVKFKDLNITVILHAPVKESIYRDWFNKHSNIRTVVYYPLQNFFEDLGKYFKISPLKQIRKISFSLYKKYRRFILRNKLQNIDVFIDYKNMEFFKELYNISKPKIAWLHGSLSYFESHNTFKRLPLYSRFVGITDEFVSDFKQKYPKYADKIVRIYNPINVSDIQQRAKDAQSPDGKYFCHVSRLVDGKDIKTLLDAFELFAKSNKTVKLYIIGDGDKASEFKSYAQTLKSNARIIFTGTLNNPYGFMKGAIANILSSEYEGFGMVPLESMALGIPIIISNYKCGSTEILMNGKCGSLFQIGDVKALVDHMHTVVNNQNNKINAIRVNSTKSLIRFYATKIAKQVHDFVVSQKDAL